MRARAVERKNPILMTIVVLNPFVKYTIVSIKGLVGNKGWVGIARNLMYS